MSDSRIFVTFALPQESRDFQRALRAAPDEDIRCDHFGVGPAVAAERIGDLLSRFRIRLLICAGFAGGLDPRLTVGDLVVAENLSTPEICARARAGVAAASVHCGPIVSRALPVESVADKAALFRETGALAVDMESEAVSTACRATGVPVLVVRTISDPAGSALPVPFAAWFDLPRQRPRVLGLLQYLALHPTRIAPFARFVRGLAPARQALTEFLTHFVQTV